MFNKNFIRTGHYNRNVLPKQVEHNSGWYDNKRRIGLYKLDNRNPVEDALLNQDNLDLVQDILRKHILYYYDITIPKQEEADIKAALMLEYETHMRHNLSIKFQRTAIFLRRALEYDKAYNPVTKKELAKRSEIGNIAQYVYMCNVGALKNLIKAVLMAVSQRLRYENEMNKTYKEKLDRKFKRRDYVVNKFSELAELNKDDNYNGIKESSIKRYVKYGFPIQK